MKMEKLNSKNASSICIGEGGSWRHNDVYGAKSYGRPEKLSLSKNNLKIT